MPTASSRIWTRVIVFIFMYQQFIFMYLTREVIWNIPGSSILIRFAATFSCKKDKTNLCFKRLKLLISHKYYENKCKCYELVDNLFLNKISKFPPLFLFCLFFFIFFLSFWGYNLNLKHSKNNWFFPAKFSSKWKILQTERNMKFDDSHKWHEVQNSTIFSHDSEKWQIDWF